MPAIHRFGDPRDVAQAIEVEVSISPHHADAGDEPLEVSPLGGDQWMIFEEGNNPVDEILPTLHGEAK